MGYKPIQQNAVQHKIEWEGPEPLTEFISFNFFYEVRLNVTNTA